MNLCENLKKMQVFKQKEVGIQKQWRENEFFLKKLHAQKTFWKPNSKNALRWAFYCVNDNKEVDLTTHQIMCCILFHNSLILNLTPKIQARKG
jgi:hypothetical protein